LPLVFASLLSALVNYKLRKYTFKKYLWQNLIWLTILVGLASTKYIYEFLFSNQLTQTEPLSLFDVVQITGIVTVLYMANRARLKIDALEVRLRDLHQELSIRLSNDKKG
jgi:hypothetical protein